MPQNKEKESGSRSDREPEFLVIGKLRRPHGVRGEIPMEIYTHFMDIVTPEQTVYVGEKHQPVVIEHTRWKNTLILLKFYEIDDRTEVSAFTNDLVFVKPDALPPLETGEFYYHDLIGLEVFDHEDQYLGILTQILETGANDVYLIKNAAGEELLLPAIEEVILVVDLVEKRMVVKRQPWYGEGD